MLDDVLGTEVGWGVKQTRTLLSLSLSSQWEDRQAIRKLQVMISSTEKVKQGGVRVTIWWKVTIVIL